MKVQGQVNRGVGKASFRSHRADRPVRRVGRRRTQCPLDYLGKLIVVDGARAVRAGFVKQAITAFLQKSTAPLCSWMPSSAATDLLGRPSAHRRIARRRSDSERATR